MAEMSLGSKLIRVWWLLRLERKGAGESGVRLKLLAWVAGGMLAETGVAGEGKKIGAGERGGRVSIAHVKAGCFWPPQGGRRSSRGY